MFFITLFRIIKASFKNFVRNGWLSIAAVIMMVVTLIVISSFAILSFLINVGTKVVQEKADMSVYIRKDAKKEDVEKFESKLKNLDNVKEIKFVSSEEATEDYREIFKDNPKLLEAISSEGNPLLASYQVLVEDPDELENIKAIVEGKEYKKIVDHTSYEGRKKEIIDRIVKISNFVKKSGWFLASIFIFISLIIIYNTIRITIFTRKEEIEIMKLVGATHWFIRGPFIFEGMIYGVFGMVISIMILYPFLYLGAPVLSRYFGNIGDIFQVLKSHLALIVLLELFLGVGIGIISSFFAIRRYLKLI